jgi:predicted AAA+ superfamily ATPase
MDKQVLKQVLLDNAQLVAKIEVLPRDYDLDESVNYVFTGVRRAGKSYMMYAIIKQLLQNGLSIEDILYLNFEDERIENFTVADFNLLLECHQEIYGRKPRIFLDEMQNIDGWEKFARRMADSKAHICLTGSNARMLSKEVMSTLGGRFIPRDIYPYSFKEYLNAMQVPYSEKALLSTAGRALFFRQYREYFFWGGMPESVGMKIKRDYLSSTYQKIYLNDIVSRNKISNIGALRLLIKKMAESVKQPVSYNRLSNILSTIGGKISVPTVQSYITHTEDAWFVLRLRNIAGALTEKESICKYYFIDNGFLNLFLLDGESSLLENMVAIELFRRFGHDPENDTVYFYNAGEEVDFYIPEAEWAIQVAYNLSEETTRQREVAALTKIVNALPCKRRTIITFDSKDTVIDAHGEIEVIPCWEWLLH